MTADPNPAPDDGEWLATAVAAARAAGHHARQNLDRRQEVAEAFDHDIKLRLDGECQQCAEAVIRAEFPGHAILGEEGGGEKDAATPTWIIDPIDGTVNFYHGLPLWCASVAVRSRGEMVAGAVYVPMLNELYTATRHTPARCNGRPIRVSATPRLDEGLVLTGISKHVRQAQDVSDWFMELALRARKVRLMGAAAIDMCHVASGRADGYFETGIYLWDFAAAGLIARQAGARVELLRQFDDYRIRCLVTNGLIHEELKTLLQEKASHLFF